MSSDFSESDTTFHLLIKKLIPSINTNINTNDFFIIGLRNVLIQPFVLLTNVSNIYNSTVYQKHRSLHNYIRCDICFVPIEKREEIFALFTNIQKHYMSLLKFYNVCKFKILSKRLCKQYDLFFNDLDDSPDNLKIVLYEQTRLYTFKIYDILNIIKSSLINYEELFLVPSLPKNPYTNLPFSYKNMYNIFYHCLFNHITIPKVFRYFYESDFDLNKFIYNYEPIVRESIITSYHNNMTFNEKYDTILTIVDYYKRTIPIIIHDSYPKEKVLTFLGTSIDPYLRSQYSMNPAIKDSNRITLVTILQKLYSLNKNFGRVYFNVKTGEFAPLDEHPQVFVDPSTSPFNFGQQYIYSNNNNSNNSNNNNNNNNSNNNDNIAEPFIFGNTSANHPVNYDTSDDMDIDSDISDDVNMILNILPEHVTTTADILTTSFIDTIIDPSFSNRPPFTSPVFNPIVRPRHITAITDMSLTSLSNEEINNARTRIREMLAGDDYEG